MSKQAPQPRAKRTGPIADQAARPAARLREPDEGAKARGSTRASRSAPARLAREVARLEAELETMRVRLREVEALAVLDPLTGLLNRRGFQREIERACAYIRRYGGRAVLAYFDLDGFKAVNDRHGHAAGDAVLRAAAGVLKQNVRASDAIARLGGDEFALLLWNLSDADAAAKALALEQAIALAVIDWAGEPIAVAACAGTAPLAGTDPLAALAGADAAMYQRKRARRRSEIKTTR